MAALTAPGSWLCFLFLCTPPAVVGELGPHAADRLGLGDGEASAVKIGVGEAETGEKYTGPGLHH